MNAKEEVLKKLNNELNELMRPTAGYERITTKRTPEQIDAEIKQIDKQIQYTENM